MDTAIPPKKKHRGPNVLDTIRAAKAAGARSVRFERGGVVVVNFDDGDNPGSLEGLQEAQS